MEVPCINKIHFHKQNMNTPGVAKHGHCPYKGVHIDQI